MASLEPNRCDYCGAAPCIGADCPAEFYDQDDDMGGEWEPCWHCGGHGGWHDCGDDTCCCLEPEDDVECDECFGRGGWYV